MSTPVKNALPPPGGRAGARPQPAKRRAGVRAGLFLVVAVVAALIAALLFTRYVERRTAEVRVPTAKVVVAALDLPLATTLRPESLAVVDWPLSSRPEGTTADPASVTGRVALAPMFKGEPILAGKLASGEIGSGLSAILPAGMRAAAVRVDDVVGVAGFIHPGDRVDVIVTMKPTEGSVPPMSKVILQGVRVLAVGKELATKGKSLDRSIPATVATLMVTAEDSERLALAAAKGQILLTLRSSVDLEPVATSGMTPPVLLLAKSLDPPAPTAPAPPPTRRAAPVARARPAQLEVRPAGLAAPAPPQRDAVEILRGDLFEKRDFEKERKP